MQRKQKSTRDSREVSSTDLPSTGPFTSNVNGGCRSSVLQMMAGLAEDLREAANCQSVRSHHRMIDTFLSTPKCLHDYSWQCRPGSWLRTPVIQPSRRCWYPFSSAPNSADPPPSCLRSRTPQAHTTATYGEAEAPHQARARPLDAATRVRSSMAKRPRASRAVKRRSKSCTA